MSGVQPFAVVLFLDGDDEQMVSEVPSSWLTDDNTMCYWPNTRNVTALIARQQEPKFSWNKYPIALQIYCATLEMARSKAADIDCSTEDERRGRGYRKKKEVRKFHLGDGSSSDEGTRINLKAVPKLKMLQHVSANAASNKDVQVIGKHQLTFCDNNYIWSFTSESGDVQFCTSNATITDEAIAEFNDNTFSTNEPHHSPVDCNSTTFDNQIKQYIDDNFFSLQLHIDGKLQIVFKMLAESQFMLSNIQRQFEQSPLQEPTQPPHELMKYIPIDSAEKLESLESELTDPASKNFLMLYMKKDGGANEREFVVRNLRKLFADSFASKTSLCGQRNNIRMSNLKVIKLLQDVNDSNFKLTDKDFEKLASEWLRQSKQRLQREGKKSSVNTNDK